MAEIYVTEKLNKFLMLELSKRIRNQPNQTHTKSGILDEYVFGKQDE